MSPTGIIPSQERVNSLKYLENNPKKGGGRWWGVASGQEKV